MGKMIDTADVCTLAKEKLAQGGEVTLTITGMSMYPFLVGNRDRVTLSPIARPLKKNDLPLYRRDDGALILHRIVEVARDGTLGCCGDHQWVIERGLRRDQMLGVATAYVRKGKRLTNKNLFYRLYRMAWTWLLHYRRFFFALRKRLPTR